MFKAIWMSDLHFTRDGDVLGHDPRLRLQRAIAHINAHHADAQMCFITGDMVNRGTPEDYRALRLVLDTLAIPYMPMMGNHDRRDLLRAHLPVPEGGMTEFVQYSLETPDALFVCLDTHQVGSDGGAFCATRSAWLETTLAGAGDLPVVLFMHHPPMALGLPMQDSDNLAEGGRFLDLIARFPAVRYLCIGHVHRPISGTVRGIPFSTMRAVLYQAPAPRPAWDWETFQPAQEAPGIGVLSIAEGDITLQFDQFCGVETGRVMR